MGKVAGHPAIVQLKFEMTSTNGKCAGHNDQHFFPKVFISGDTVAIATNFWVARLTF